MNLLKKYLVIIFGLFFHFSSAQGMPTFNQYENYDHNLVIEFKKDIFKTIPDPTHAFSIPGLIMNKSGTIGKPIIPIALGENRYKFVIYGDIAVKDDGVYFERRNLNPKMLSCYKKAANYIYINNSLFLNTPAADLESLLFSTGILLNNTNNYRHRIIIKILKNYQKKREASEVFNEFILDHRPFCIAGTLASFENNFDLARECLNDNYMEELITELSNHGIETVDYKKISVLMLSFCEDLSLGIHKANVGKLSPIALAAWAHMMVMHIIPFDQTFKGFDDVASGTFARLLANTILMHYGYPPIIIINYNKYVDAINEDFIYPGSFANYVVDSMVLTSEGINKLISNF